jgi:DNA-binding XRE family transcriptional regulator
MKEIEAMLIGYMKDYYFTTADMARGMGIKRTTLVEKEKRLGLRRDCR